MLDADALKLVFHSISSEDNSGRFIGYFNFYATAKEIEQCIIKTEDSLILNINKFLRFIDGSPVTLMNGNIYISITNDNLNSAKGIECNGEFYNGWVEDDAGNYLFGTL